jgi:hypothetical protein
MSDPSAVSPGPKLIGQLAPGNLVVGGASPFTVVDGGAPASGGGGTVAAGTTAQIAQYPAGGTAVQGATVSGDATIAAGGALTIGAGVVTNAKLATMAANTFKGNATAGVAAPTDLTAAAARTNLGLGNLVTIAVPTTNPGPGLVWLNAGVLTVGT